MKLTSDDLDELAEVATRAAAEAGKMIARSRPSAVERKAGGSSLASQVVTEVDRYSEDLILAHLTPTLERFELGLLTEEQADDSSRFAADAFWCIDPLDGTLPFIEGIPGSAVSIALVSRDGDPLIGVIHDIAEGTLFQAVQGGGAFRDGRPWTPKLPPGAEVLSVFADRSFLTMDSYDEVISTLEQIAQDRGLTGLRLNATAGAVMNACGVLASAPACYVKYPGPSGGGSLWDFAATACLFGEVGAVATDIQGEPLDLNQADSTFMNHRGVVFATDEELSQLLCDTRP